MKWKKIYGKQVKDCNINVEVWSRYNYMRGNFVLDLLFLSDMISKCKYKMFSYEECLTLESNKYFIYIHKICSNLEV